MAKTFTCDDGFVARGEDDYRLWAEVQRHLAEHHPDLVGKVSRDEILASAVEATIGASRVHAALPAADLARARRFYEDTLGLEPVEERPEGVRYEVGGSALFLFPTPVAARAGHTQAGIEVPDVAAAVAELRARGVAFLENGVAAKPGSRAAWFTDSEGNTIALVQFT